MQENIDETMHKTLAADEVADGTYQMIHYREPKFLARNLKNIEHMRGDCSISKLETNLMLFEM